MKPMLSGKAPKDLSTLTFPLYVSPKLDGIRAIVKDGVLLSRNLKPIPNQFTQELFNHLEGYDGELIVGPANDKDCFRKTTSGVMSHDGEPDVSFYVFDKWDFSGTWEQRFDMVESLGETIIKVHHQLVYSVEEITRLEEAYLADGYEGVMLRSPNGLYKFGRSTTREEWLLKLKRFEDGEALVIGMEEKMHNANEATINALGHTERTSHQENLKPLDTLGALIVRDIKTGVEFNIGSGFTDEDRRWWWDQLINIGHVLSYGNNGGAIATITNPDVIVKYQYFPLGSKDKPRFPTYLGIRKD